MDNKTKKFISELLEISEQDLLASEILYHDKKYPQAVYLLQQSAEKATKAYGLFCDEIDMSQLISPISHNSEKVFSLSIEKHMNECADCNKNFKRELEEIKRGILLNPKKAKLTKILFAYLPKKSIMRFVNRSSSNEEFRKIFINSEELAKSFKSPNKMIKKLNKNRKIYFGGELFAISWILSIHSETTRYPNEYLNPKTYDKNLGIVKSFIPLGLRLVQIIALFKNQFYSEFPDIKPKIKCGC